MASPPPDQARPRTILLATDLSARSDRALERSVNLARRWGAQLVLLHVLPRDSAVSDDGVMALKERIWREVPARDIGFRIEVARGAVAATVDAKARELGADLIVTGVAHVNAIGDFILGNDVERIVRDAPAPVLVVKHKPVEDYGRLVVASDFSNPSRHALEAAARLFPELPLRLVHAYHVPFEGFVDEEGMVDEVKAEHRRECDAFLEGAELPASARERLTTDLGYGTTCEVVARAVGEQAADLAVVGTHGRSGFRAAVIGSTAEALLSCLPSDVLMVRQPAR